MRIFLRSFRRNHILRQILNGQTRWLDATGKSFGKKDVSVKGRIKNFSDYDTAMIGFPIRNGAASNVENTFCKGYDWSGKRVFAFATLAEVESGRVLRY